MNVSDIIALSKAGFTAEQISGFKNIDEAAPAAPVAPPAPAAPAAPVAPAAPAVPAATSPDAAILAEIQKLTGAIQANSLLSSQQPKSETVEDILASVINPKTREVVK